MEIWPLSTELRPKRSCAGSVILVYDWLPEICTNTSILNSCYIFIRLDFYRLVGELRRLHWNERAIKWIMGSCGHRWLNVRGIEMPASTRARRWTEALCHTEVHVRPTTQQWLEAKANIHNAYACGNARPNWSTALTWLYHSIRSTTSHRGHDGIFSFLFSHPTTTYMHS